MILTRLDALTAYRMHTPKWAVAPTSRAGTAQHGGHKFRNRHVVFSAAKLKEIERFANRIDPIGPPNHLLQDLFQDD